MRYILALMAMVAGLLLLIVGLVPRAIILFSPSYQLTAEKAATAPYTVIKGEDLRSLHQNAKISAGQTAGAIAVGSYEDITAWAAPYGYTEVRIDVTKKRSGEVSEHAVEAKEPAGDAKPETKPVKTEDFVRSDLWASTKESGSAGELAIEGTQLSNKQAVIFAGKDGTALGKNLEISWKRSNSTPLVGPLLTA
ncbi:MAG: hypothetical protein Q4C71_04585, partial [Microbacteriaceae bacterium]|nr:hypothetical protein [Microbacteriaceae bacterium]